jgi:SAM-dependent methyltransferase
MQQQAPGQRKQSEWHEQWSLVQDDEEFLFNEWIQPFTLEKFRGKDVLECGCGGGQHTSFVSPYAKQVVAVDLNTTNIARERNKARDNIQFVEADIATMDLQRSFDVVFSIGVVHHTDDPDATFRNLLRHVKPGGTLIVWVYSQEGNALVSQVVEPLRKRFLERLQRRTLLTLSQAVCALMYAPIHTLYRLPLTFLPYYEYFENFRRLSFYRNTLNVFDKLNAPQVQFINRKRIEGWFDSTAFSKVTISPYKGVSWTGVGVVAGGAEPELNFAARESYVIGTKRRGRRFTRYCETLVGIVVGFDIRPLVKLLRPLWS